MIKAEKNGALKRFNDLSLIKKILILLLVAGFFIGLIDLWYINSRFTKFKKQVYQETEQRLESNLRTAIDNKETTWLTNSLLIANNPNLQKFIYDGDREAIIATLKDYSKIFKDNTNFKNVKIHIIDSDLTSLVKSWEPDSYGEDLSYSDAYQAVKNRREGFSTCEESPKGMRLKGLFPVIYQNRFMGIVNFEGGLNSVKRNFKKQDMEFLYFLKKEYLDVARSLTGKPEVGNYILSQKDTDKEFLQYALNDLDLKEAREGYTLNNGYFSIALPITDFKGEEIGLYLAAQREEIVNKSIQANKNTLFSMFVFVTIIGVSVTALLLLLLYRYVIVPIKYNVNLLKDLSQGEGDLTSRLPVRSRDEFGQMAGYLNSFLNKLQDIVRSISKNADRVGDYAGRQPAAFNEIASFSTDIATKTSSVAAATEEASTSINSISASAEEMSASINAVASSIEEINRSYKEMASRFQQEAGMVENAKNHSSSTKEKMDELGDSASKITKVVEVINKIATQTDLLAINATIEAAAAGEAGKGFAVVANEVKKLAKDSASATEDIKIQIKGMQNVAEESISSIDTIVDLISEITTTSHSLAEMVERQTAAVNDIADNISAVSSVSDEIAVNVQDSANGLSEVSSNIQNVEQDSNQTAAKISQMRDDVNKLKEMSENLKNVVGQFKF